MERDNTEKTHREGWLKRVLEEANDYNIPELIDPDEYEESTSDLVPSDEDGAEIPGRVGSDDDGGAMPVLFEAEADGSSGGSDEAPQKHSWSHKDVEYEHSNVRENFEDTDETKSIPAVTKGKARPHTAEPDDNGKSTTFAEDTSHYDDGTGASPNTRQTTGKTTAIKKNNPLEERAGATSGKKAVVANDFDKSLC